MTTIVTQQQAEAQPVVIHDLTNGKRAQGIRIGDYAVTESGLYVVRGGDGHQEMHLHLVEARHAQPFL